MINKKERYTRFSKHFILLVARFANAVSQVTTKAAIHLF